MVVASVPFFCWVFVLGHKLCQSIIDIPSPCVGVAAHAFMVVEGETLQSSLQFSTDMAWMGNKAILILEKFQCNGYSYRIYVYKRYFLCCSSNNIFD